MLQRRQRRTEIWAEATCAENLVDVLVLEVVAAAHIYEQTDRQTMLVTIFHSPVGSGMG